MQANVYTRERKHIGTRWSRVTYLALLLATAKSLGSQVLEDSQRPETSNSKQINKQYTNQCLNSNQIVPKHATPRYERVSARIT
jgi:hypothetical protein